MSNSLDSVKTYTLYLLEDQKEANITRHKGNFAYYIFTLDQYFIFRYLFWGREEINEVYWRENNFKSNLVAFNPPP